MGHKDVVIDSDGKSITFCGLVFREWGHIRWLHRQLEIMEANAEKLWGDEKVALALEKQRDTVVTKFTVIDGDKDAKT